MNKINTFDAQFITELFLDNDSNSTINRLAVTVANIIHENNENMYSYNEAIGKEFSNILQLVNGHPVVIHRNKIKHNNRNSKNNDLYEQTVYSFTDEDYITNFKIKKSTVQALIKYLHEHVKIESTSVSLAKKVHIFLYLLTSAMSYNDVAELFGLKKSSVRNIFNNIAAVLFDQRYHFINWPSLDEQNVTRIKVNNRFQFPNCVGFIDACRFNVGSKRTKKSCLDAIMLQAVCDESLYFIDVHIGSIGKTKKNKVFKESKLSHELKNCIDFDNHILGDSDYKLKYNLLTPFSTEELLTSEEMKYNEIHWKTRSYIGHAFELLKEKFKKLSHLDLNNCDSVETILVAACVLHNFIMIHEGCPEVKQEPVVCYDVTLDITMNIDTNVVKTPDEKRQFICNYINYMIVNNLPVEDNL